MKTLNSSRPGGRRSIPSNLAVSNIVTTVCSSIMCIKFHMLYSRQKKCSRKLKEYISAHCLLCSTLRYLSSKQIEHCKWCPRMEMVICMPEFSMSSWRCELWSPNNSSPYSLYVRGQSSYFQTLVISQVDLDIWLFSSIDVRFII